MTTIRYFVPEDGDLEEHPNIYLMPKPAQSGFSPRLKDVKDSFPMPGTYHFRFKCPLIPGTDREKSAVSVWMDCVDDNQHVGVWRNTIVAKVTRINMNDDADVVDVDQIHRTFDPKMSHSQGNVEQANSHQQPSVHAAPIRPTRTIARLPPSSGEANLLGRFDPPTSAPGDGDLLGAPPTSVSGGGLLDMDGPVYGNGVARAPSHDDFLGMTSTPISSPPQSGSGTTLNPPTPKPILPQSSSQQRQPNVFSNAGPFGGLEWK